jgi:hypothetical protein
MHVAHYGAPLRQIRTPLPVSWIPLLDAAAAERGIARTDLIREIIEGWLGERGLVAQRGATGGAVPRESPAPGGRPVLTEALRAQWETLDATERARLVYQVQRLRHLMDEAGEGER